MQHIIARFKEPSSWAALAAGATSLGIVIPAGWVQTISLIGAGIATLLGIFLKEKGG